MDVLITAVSRFQKPTGICRSAANLANCLLLHSDVTRVYLAVGEWQVSYFQENFHMSSDRIEVIPISIKNSSLARNWWYLIDLPRLVKTLDCSMVHLSYPVPVLSSLFSIPIIVTLHDLYPFEIPKNFGYPQVYLNQAFTRLCLANCDGLTCISAYTFQQFLKYFPRNKKPSTIIYHTVDFKDDEPQKPLRLSKSDTFVLAVAQHRKNKNLDILIQAFYKLKKWGNITPNTLLVIVGSQDSETNFLIQLANKLDITEQVLFLSSLVDSELAWLFENCRLLVLPSSVEGLGLPVIEGLHYNCRIICSDIPTLREVGGEQCDFFSLEIDAVSNLEHALIRVWNSPRRINKEDLRFNKKAISDQYLTFYKSLFMDTSEESKNHSLSIH